MAMEVIMEYCPETDSEVCIRISFNRQYNILTEWTCTEAALYRCDTYKKTLQCPLLDSILEKKHLYLP